MSPQNRGRAVGVGPTEELSLRVSAATLARVLFPGSPADERMLALEHKATLGRSDGGPQVAVKAQPFGGAVRLLNMDRLQSSLDGFRFDSERSRSERDFRIFIRPTDWDAIREFCLAEFSREVGSALETDPSRELAEEFTDALGIQLRPNQYSVKPVRIVVEHEPVPTENVHALGYPTARIYQVFDVRVLDPGICQAILTNSEDHPARVLRRLALWDARRGGRGRANAMLAAPEQEIRSAFLAIPPEMRREPLPFQNTLLDRNVPAVLESIVVPQFRAIERS